MKTMKRRLICLNIAIVMLMIRLCVGYASALEVKDHGTVQNAELFSEGTMIGTDELQNDDSELNELNMQNSRAAKVWTIQVGNYSFRSNQNRIGSGWEYDADSGSLYLNEYSGGRISASGDLDIYSIGDVSITGDNNPYGDGIAEQGILVEGSLNLFVYGGTLTIRGGNGSVQGGDGIRVLNDMVCRCFENGSLDVEGGVVTRSGGTFNGDGIWCDGFTNLFGDGSMIINGGSNSIGEEGGYGIRSDGVGVGCYETEINGGNGQLYGGSGINYGSHCEFGIAYISIHGGNGTYKGYALTSDGDTGWYYREHTTVDAEDYDFYIVPDVYTITLSGNGGRNDDGEEEINISVEYPHLCWLNAGIFQRDGYTQVAWKTSQYGNSEDVYILSAGICPEENMTLYADWIKSEKGDIVLNTLEGDFADGSFFKKYSSTSVRLPNSLVYSDKDVRLLAWCDSTIPSTLGSSEDNSYVCEGKWYEGGETIKSDPSITTELYAYQAYGGDYAIYHPTQGTVKQGGSIIVQQSSIVSPGSLEIIFPGEEFLNAPDGYELEGWSSKANADKAEYMPGESLEKWGYYDIPHFYAVWKVKEYKYSPDSGIDITFVPAAKKIKIAISDSWCSKTGVQNVACALYNDNGQMIQTAMRQAVSGRLNSMELTYSGDALPDCKIFALDAVYKPIMSEIDVNLRMLIKKPIETIYAVLNSAYEAYNADSDQAFLIEGFADSKAFSAYTIDRNTGDLNSPFSIAPLAVYKLKIDPNGVILDAHKTTGETVPVRGTVSDKDGYYTINVDGVWYSIDSNVSVYRYNTVNQEFNCAMLSSIRKGSTVNFYQINGNSEGVDFIIIID